MTQTKKKTSAPKNTKVTTVKKKVNKKDEQKPIVEVKKEPLKNEVIAVRSDAKDTTAIEIIFIVVGILLVGFCVAFLIITKFLTDTKDMFLKVITPIAGIIGILNLFVSIDCLVKIKRNKTAQKECIIYDPNRNIVIFNTLKGKNIEIKPEQFESVVRGVFSTYGMFAIKYKNNQNKSRLEYLGWSHDVDVTNKRINELKK